MMWNANSSYISYINNLNIFFQLYFLQIRLDNKVAVHSGILCLNPKVLTIMGGIVSSLYEEWQLSQKYSGFSRSSLRPSQNENGVGPPPFEKLQIGVGPHRTAQQQASHGNVFA